MFWHKDHRSVVLFWDKTDDDDEKVFDYSQRKVLLGTGTGDSATVVDTAGIGWKTNHGASTDNRGLIIRSTTEGTLHGFEKCTILAYLKVHSENRDDTNEHVIYHEWDSNKRTVLFRYDPNSNRMEGGVFGDDQQFDEFSAASDIDDGEFHLVVMRYNGARVSLWLDGIEDSTGVIAAGTLGEGTPSESDWSISASTTNDGGQYIWSWAAVFAEAWSDDEIRKLSVDPFGPFRRFDEAGVVFDSVIVVPPAADNSLNPWLRRRRR